MLYKCHHGVRIPNQGKTSAFERESTLRTVSDVVTFIAVTVIQKFLRVRHMAKKVLTKLSRKATRVLLKFDLFRSSLSKVMRMLRVCLSVCLSVCLFVCLAVRLARDVTNTPLIDGILCVVLLCWYRVGNYCRVFTQMAESFLDAMVTTPNQVDASSFSRASFPSVGICRVYCTHPSSVRPSGLVRLSRRLTFTTRCTYRKARYCHHELSVRLSVRPSVTVTCRGRTGWVRG